MGKRVREKRRKTRKRRRGRRIFGEDKARERR